MDTLLDMGIRRERTQWKRLVRAAPERPSAAAAWTLLGSGLGAVVGAAELGASLASAGAGTLLVGAGALLAYLERAVRSPQSTGVWPPSVDTSAAAEGLIRGADAARAPATGRACLAYAVSLYDIVAPGGPLVVSEAYTSGFEIHAADGRVLRVPAGWLRVGGSHGVEVTGRRRRAYLRGVFGWRAPRGRLVERVLRDGNRVRVVGSFTAPRVARCAPYRGSSACDCTRVADGPIYMEEVVA